MEQDKEQSKKRSYALPITLLLLVFSLTGNVFLYSQSLQGGQDDKYNKGLEVIGAAKKATSYYQAVLDDTAAILEGKTSEAGTVIRDAAGVNDFLQQAGSFDTDNSFDSGKIYANMIDVDNSLSYIKEQDGSLTEQESAFLKALQEVYSKQLAIVKQFNFDADKTRSGAIQIGAGIGWLDIAKQLEQSIEEQSSMKLSAQ
ncbi:hypothetical protein [Paenibacillus sp. JDR-2]|uniref:hypothetical protein n=1 Tax=Paenibacillus sp. (strain JDR-2) TaxID=324057 RepID=UPI0001663AB6|nr:hypothetical protein [Paenibacillus sp. JDR-2]ACT00877.1 hypothetical protein Pjdr2_2221 [Paenibacillus sp. JDR-2]